MNDEVSSCTAGPTLVRDLLQSDQTYDQDANLALWQQAAMCDWRVIDDQAGNEAISEFHVVAHDNGLAGGLRTFARNGDFRLYVEDIKPMPLGEANSYLNHQPLMGTWRDAARGRSGDSTLLYAAGEISLKKRVVSHYAEVWQFDPKVANWGVRLLMLKPVMKK